MVAILVCTTLKSLHRCLVDIYYDNRGNGFFANSYAITNNYLYLTNDILVHSFVIIDDGRAIEDKYGWSVVTQSQKSY